MAASATLALKAGACVRRVRFVIVAPDPRQSRRSQAGFPLNELSEFGQPPQTLRLSSQYLLALRDADCAEQPIGWLGIIPPDFDGSSPSAVMVEVFGRDAMERTQPFLKAAVIAVDVVDVEVGCLRPRPTGGR